MPVISRRDLLSSGLALSASSILTRSAWARTAALAAVSDGRFRGRFVCGRAPRATCFSTSAGSSVRPWNRSRARSGLRLQPGQILPRPATSTLPRPSFDDSKWRALNLPHDWAVELPFVRDDEQKSHGYKPLGRRYPETSVGWYRREFEIPASDLGRRICVEFDGAFRDVLVFVNGCFIGRNDNGYAPFRFDLTDFLAVRREELHRVARRCEFWRRLVLRGRGHLSPRVADQDRRAAPGQVGSQVRPECSGGNLAVRNVVANVGKKAESAR